MMKGHLRSALLLALVVGVLISPVVGIGVAQDGGDAASPENETLNASEVEANGTIEGLRELGVHRGNSPPSVRPWGDYGQFYLRYVPAGLGIAAGDMKQARYVEPDTVIRRDTVHIGSFRGWNSDPFNGTVHVVVWDIKDVQTTDENGSTTTRQELDVLATSSEEIELKGGDYDTAPVRIPPAYNGTAYVTLWVEGHREQTQWVARIDSSTASQAVGINSLADAVGWGFVWMFLPLLLTTAGMIVVDRKVLDKAGRGPNVGAIEYAFFTCAALFLGGFVFYHGVIETLAEAPYLLGVAGGILMGLFAIWAFSDRGKEVLFLQFTAADGNAAADGSGDWHLANRVHTVVERADGKNVVPRDGWLPFFARLWPFFDAAPLLEFDAPNALSSHRRLESPPVEEVKLADDAGTWERIRTRFWGTASEDAYDEVYLVDPMADDVIEYESESFELTFPQLVHWPENEDEGTWVRGTPIPAVSMGKIVGAVVFVMGAHFAGSAFFSSTTLGGLTASLAALLLVVRPSGGAAHVRLAAAHYDAVIANMIQHLEGYSEQADAEHFQKKYHESEAKRRASRKREDETRDHNVFRELSDRLAPADGDPAPTKGVTEASSDD